MPDTTGLVVVLDNEAVQALASPVHSKHRSLIATVAAVSSRNQRRPGSMSIVVPTVVRVEALIDRTDPRCAELGRLRVRDVPLDGPAADRAVALRRAGGGSPVDAVVAQVAESAGRAVIVTADGSHLPPLVAACVNEGDIRIVLV